MILKTIVTDVERAGEALVREIKALPSQIEHAVIDVFKVIAKDVSPQALKAAVALAEDYVTNVLPKWRGLVEGTVVALADPVEHTQAFEWVKGELLSNGVVKDVPDAHTLAALAWALVNRGVSLIEAKITGDETQAIVDAAK